jgi:hypothetical protein
MQDKIRKEMCSRGLPRNELAKELQGRNKLLENILKVKDFVTRKEEKEILFSEIQMEDKMENCFE